MGGDPGPEVVAHLLAHVEQTSDFIGVADPWGKILYLNPAAKKRLGLDDIDGVTVADLFPLESFAFYYEVVRPQLLRTGSWSGEILVKAATGPAVPMYLSTTGRIGPGGETNGGVVSARELSAGTAVATTNFDLDDSGALRPEAFMSVLDDALQAAGRTGERCSLVIVDVVDVRGAVEARGDALAATMRTFVARLRRLARTIDTVAQLSPTRLCFLARSVRDETTVSRHAQLIVHELHDPPVTTAAGEVVAEIEIGFALSHPDDDVPSFLARASAMLHDHDVVSAAGGTRRGRTDAAVPALRHELPRAMSSGDIKPYVRPVVDLRDGRLAGFRGSARWHHAELGVLDPRVFIDVVAESPLATVVDLFVARETAGVIALRSRGEPLHLYACAGERLIADARTEEYLTEIADAFFVPLERVHVEVACAVVAGWTPAASHGLRYLQDVGIATVLGDVDGDDDLDLAHEQRVAEVCTTRRWTAAAGTEVAARAAFTELVARAHDVGLVVTATGVDGEAERDAVVAAGCDFAIGDLFGAAQPAHAVE
jgi:EAL domain-containing protein (putative c-di-GMP-specific phosphodiesterase class I)/GGDEF domain-containing protein